MTNVENISLLIRKRGAIKHRFTNFSNYLSQVQDELERNVDVENNVNELFIRHSKFENVWEEFEGIQINIESLVSDDKLDEQYSLRDWYMNNYSKCLALATTLLNKYKAVDKSIANFSAAQVDNSCGSYISESQNVSQVQHIRLPIIELPKFDGNYNAWLEFRETFESLIDRNNSISNIQKFHYLRASLKADALKVIQAIEFTSDNYQTAWELICSRYNNKRLLVQNHIKSIFELEVIAKESSKAIRNLIDNIFKHLRSLEALGEPVDSWDSILIYVLTAKLDKVTIRDWEKLKGLNENPKIADLKKFLNDKADFLETIELNHVSKIMSVEGKRERSTSLVGTKIENTKRCNFCKKNHLIYSCREFLNLNVVDRLKKVKDLNLCNNCLCSGHWSKFCKSRRCSKCSQKHNFLLHNNVATVVQQAEPESSDVSNEPSSQVSLISNQKSKNSVLLATAKILVKDAEGNYHSCRAILDNGSMSNLITNEFVNQLRLRKGKSNVAIVGINQVESNLKFTCDVTIKSRVTDFETNISCFVLPSSITDKLPSTSLDTSRWNIPNVKLADPEFHVSKQVDLLIGASIFWDLLLNESINLRKDLPLLHSTVFGWIVTGTINNNMVKTFCNFIKISNSELHDSLNKFWNLEEVDSDLPSLNNENEICEKHFLENVQTINGRFKVCIPLKFPRESLGESKQIAIKRFLNLERQFKDDLDLKIEYSKFMREYTELGHMSLTNSNDTSCVSYFLPHHGILRPDSLTTKLRVVFDGSCPTTSGVSLNDIQYTGPVCQNDLISILMRFRQYNYVICADITKMYRQILIHEDDKALQKIVWRFNENDPLLTYTLNTVTYGTKSAPYLAIRCIKQLAVENRDKFPEAALRIDRDFYVDDLITGFNNKKEAVNVCQDIARILSGAGFLLRKWSSNNIDILSQQCRVELQTELLFNNDETVKTLGMSWNRHSDEFLFSVKELTTTNVTKRVILSNIAKLFDPLGLISPCIILIKILIQKLWKLKLDWDDSIPQELEETWLKFKDNLSCLNNLKITRHMLCKDAVVIQLHGFCDASNEAYGAVLYMKSIDRHGKVNIHLVCSKTKVAPVKPQLTIPKLELSGAVLLSRLVNKLLNSLTLTNIDCFMWCDSQIVLSWIKTSPMLLNRFESNRVTIIQNLTKNCSWAYINTKNNPADLASRGKFPDLIINCLLWWNGPEWLKLNKEMWPVVPCKLENTVVCISTKAEFSIFGRFSRLNKLKRVIGYCLRFYFNLRAAVANKTKKLGFLSVEELEQSIKIIIKLAQKETFSYEIELLNSNNHLSRNHRLLGLAPFVDQEYVLRVGGRLKYSQLSFSSKHPILLEGTHTFTKLIIEHEHERLLHAGPQLVLSTIRQTFWPISGMNAVKKVIRNCIKCYKFNPKPMSNLMSDLPKERVHIQAPFYNTGIDYAGPIMLKDRKGRGFKLYKGYICVFVCLTVKAVHLECVTDLTTESFIAILRRFTARRGKPNVIFSDNATNFVGANKELQDLYEFLTNENDIIANICANDNIKWRFIPPNAPHFGGLWEAAVKSCKGHLLRIIGNTHFTYEEMCTVLSQIEAILNSRPMYSMSPDPNDFLPITPSHFLIGKPLTMVPDPSLSEIKINKLSRLQLLQRMNQEFWKAWTRDYFSTLQRRNKWKTSTSHRLDVNSLVVIKQDDLPPCKWLTGRVLKLHPGKDKIVRVVTVKTPYGTFKRPITKLCLLPLPTNNVD